MNAVAQLHQRLFGEADVGDAARERLLDDRGGARAKAHLLADLAQFLDVLIEFVVHLPRRQRPADAHRRPSGVAARRLLDVGKDDVVDAVVGRLAGAAKGDIHPGQRLQLKGDVLDDVAHPGAFCDALHKSAVAPF